MKSHPCCEVGAKRRTWAQKCRDVAGLAIPGAILALIPKCPACLAVYIAMGTGFGISMAAATYLRGFLVVCCVASLVFLVARHVHRFIGHGVTTPRTAL